MSQQELLKRVVQVLNDLGIEYMVSGSLVSSLQGDGILGHTAQANLEPLRESQPSTPSSHLSDKPHDLARDRQPGPAHDVPPISPAHAGLLRDHDPP